MEIIKISKTDTSKLMMALEKYTNSFGGRNVAFVIQAHSKKVANITIIVTGKRGTMQRSIVVSHNELNDEWECYSQGYQFNLLALSEISTIIKSMINKLQTVLTKI